jgi:hypothetical protein
MAKALASRASRWRSRHGLPASSSGVANRKTNRCTLEVREIPLESFKHPRDGRRWREAARNRYSLLLRLSTHANPDGTFTDEDGHKNFSPSAERLQAHYARRSMYRHMNDLKDLGFLSWAREQKHYGRRIYRVTIPEETGATKADNRCHETAKQVPQLRTTSVFPSAVKEELGASSSKAVEKAAAPLASHPSSKGKTPQQKRYAIVGLLAQWAEWLLKDDPRIAEGDLVESLKKRAATNDVPYFDGWPGAASPIEQAITIARARIREKTAGVAG